MYDIQSRDYYKKQAQPKHTITPPGGVNRAMIVNQRGQMSGQMMNQSLPNNVMARPDDGRGNPRNPPPLERPAKPPKLGDIFIGKPTNINRPGMDWNNLPFAPGNLIPGEHVGPPPQALDRVMQRPDDGGTLPTPPPPLQESKPPRLNDEFGGRRNPGEGQSESPMGNPMGHQFFIREALKQGYSPDMVMQFLRQRLNLR